MAKSAKESVQFEHPAKGPNHCGMCRNFLATLAGCTKVKGKIMARDWCRLFARKAAA